MEEEAISYLFYYCTHIQDIWHQAQAYFTDCLHFPHLTPKTAIFGFIVLIMTLFFIQNHILLLLKLHLYITRNYVFLSHNNFLIDISKIKKLERRVAVNNRNKCERFRKKWHRIENKIPQDLIRNKQKNQLFKNL